MASVDKPASNRAWAESLGSNFPVLSDPERIAATAYGVLALGGLFAKRWTFYIDSHGIIRAIDRKVRPSSAGADIAKKLEELQFPRRA